MFGAAHYGANGGTIHPDDVNVMIGQSCEWQLDPATGRGKCVGVIDDRGHGAARFCRGSNGKDYLVVSYPFFLNGGTGDRTEGVKIFERLGPGQYAERARLMKVESGSGRDRVKLTRLWSDRDGDEKQDKDEIIDVPGHYEFARYYNWSLHLGNDLTWFPGREDKVTVEWRVKGFTKCGAPIYDPTNAPTLPGNGGLPSLDGRFLLTTADAPGYFGKELLCVDVRSKKILWKYPANWSGVHGSHHAPAAQPGLLRGFFGFIGTAQLPEPVGNIWILNSNCGEWHVLNQHGYYLTKLFEGDATSVQYPETAAPGTLINDIPPGGGGEDFGGSVIQASDRRIFAQAGKTAYVKVETQGWDQFRTIASGNLSLSFQQVLAANQYRNEALQKGRVAETLEVPQKTPTFTGNLHKDFPGVKQVQFKKNKDAEVTTVICRDNTHLFVGWHVVDATPWVNGADTPFHMYARGDTVDLQLATDPNADPQRKEPVLGDLRLSIGNYKGEPTAVIYRKVAREKHPHIFSSGVVPKYVMDSVKVLSARDVRLHVEVGSAAYTVEAALPLSELGVKPVAGVEYLADFGATHSKPDGRDTGLRTYWNNRATGIVDDEVFELKMEPRYWGRIKFTNP